MHQSAETRGSGSACMTRRTRFRSPNLLMCSPRNCLKDEENSKREFSHCKGPYPFTLKHRIENQNLCSLVLPVFLPCLKVFGNRFHHNILVVVFLSHSKNGWFWALLSLSTLVKTIGTNSNPSTHLEIYMSSGECSVLKNKAHNSLTTLSIYSLPIFLTTELWLQIFLPGNSVLWRNQHKCITTNT